MINNIIKQCQDFWPARGSCRQRRACVERRGLRRFRRKGRTEQDRISR